MDLQTAFNIIIAIAGTFGGWLLKMIYDAIRDLRVDDSIMRKEMQEIITTLPSTYLRRDDARDLIARLEQGMSDLRVEMREGLGRVFDKIDAKADKQA